MLKFSFVIFSIILALIICLNKKVNKNHKSFLIVFFLAIQLLLIGISVSRYATDNIVKENFEVISYDVVEGTNDLNVKYIDGNKEEKLLTIKEENILVGLENEIVFSKREYKREIMFFETIILSSISEYKDEAPKLIVNEGDFFNEENTEAE